MLPTEVYVTRRRSAAAMPRFSGLQTWLARPAARRWAVVFAVLLTLGSLHSGLQTEDWVHAMEVRHGPGLRQGHVNLFAYIPGDRADNHRSKQIGTLPWFAPDNLRISFWRPLTSLTHRLDYGYFANWPWLMHAQSIAWYAALVAAAGVLFRRIAPSAAAAGLATVLYAIDDAHGSAVGWLANRSAILATLAGVGCLIAHDRWRRDGWRPGAVWGPGAFALALLSAEAGTATAAYLAAHAAMLDRERPWRRVLALVPFAIVGGIWSTAYRALGHGATASGFYIDPGLDPGRFARAVVERLPILWFAQVGGPHPETSMVAVWEPAVLHVIVLSAIIFFGLVAWVLAPILARSASARFWGVGMLLSAIPACSTFPGNRLLFFIGLGGAGLVAELLVALVQPASRLPTRATWRVPAMVLAGYWLFDHAVRAPVGMPDQVGMMARYGEQLLHASDTALGGAGDATTVVVVNAPDMYFCTMMPVIRHARHLPTPPRVHCLVSGPWATHLTRVDDRTLTAASARGVAAGLFDAMYTPSDAFVGARVALSGLTVDVTAATASGEPAATSFRFDVPLDDPSLRFVTWRDSGYTPFAIPPVGARLLLPGL